MSGTYWEDYWMGRDIAEGSRRPRLKKAEESVKSTHVKFTYFKLTGKYYSEGELDIPYEEGQPVSFYSCLHIIEQMLREGKRPGLVDGHDFHTLVTVYTEYGPLSHFFARREDGTLMVQP